MAQIIPPSKIVMRYLVLEWGGHLSEHCLSDKNFTNSLLYDDELDPRDKFLLVELIERGRTDLVPVFRSTKHPE